VSGSSFKGSATSREKDRLSGSRTRVNGFAGTAGSERERVQAITERFLDTDRGRELGYGFVFSAASYLVRLGRKEIRPSEVLTEARQRRQSMEEAVRANIRRLGAGHD